MKRVGVLTSGGDAPGMNAAIRAVVRNAVHNDIAMVGILRGYQGMIDGQACDLSARDVSNIIHRGGTFLHAARCQDFMTPEGRDKAAANLRDWQLDGLVVIGGDGSFTGAIELATIWDGKIIGVPGTIDNDIYGTDYTIGFDTAVNTALENIDKIRDTAEAHERLFLIEVMGRHAGFIALDTGIGAGAEEILIPETPTDLEAIAGRLLNDRAKGKKSSILIVAEGDEAGDANEIAAQLHELAGVNSHVTVLGHIQRGGSPTAKDRVLATKMGAYAIDALRMGETGKMVGEQAGKMALVPLQDAIGLRKSIDPYLETLIRIMAT